MTLTDEERAEELNTGNHTKTALVADFVTQCCEQGMDEATVRKLVDDAFDLGKRIEGVSSARVLVATAGGLLLEAQNGLHDAGVQAKIVVGARAEETKPDEGGADDGAG